MLHYLGVKCPDDHFFLNESGKKTVCEYIERLNEKAKRGRLLPIGESRWRLYKCLLYYSFNFSMDLKIYKTLQEKIVPLKVCLRKKIFKKNKMAHNPTA